jgi:uncharacterized protein YfbU (UPF0304 family)
MTNRMVVLTGYRMEALKRRDRKKYDRLNAVISDGLKVKSDDVDFNSTLGEVERTPCPWICPVTCRNCHIEHCSDRLAGEGENA